MPDYPGAPGRTGYAVGLDVPASVIALLDDLAAAGYTTSGAPKTPRELLDALVVRRRRRRADARANTSNCSHDSGRRGRASARGLGRTGERSGGARWRVSFPCATVSAMFWSRCRPIAAARHSGAPTITIRSCRRGTRSSLSACGCNTSPKPMRWSIWARTARLEWLPGKAIALTADCFPEIVTGALPVIYPFIVSNPGEAAQAKRRIAAVTIGHLPPPLVAGGPSGEAHELELLLDEYAQADGLDRRRRERLAKLIVETAQRTGLAREAGLGTAVDPDEALRRIDAWLCDLKDLAIKDGLHIYGRAPVDHRRSGLAGKRRGRTRGAARRARRPPRRAGPSRFADARAARRAADRPQSLHRRSAHAADTDRDGAWPARRRRNRARTSADARRDGPRAS